MLFPMLIDFSQYMKNHKVRTFFICEEHSMETKESYWYFIQRYDNLREIRYFELHLIAEIKFCKTKCLKFLNFLSKYKIYSPSKQYFITVIYAFTPMVSLFSYFSRTGYTIIMVATTWRMFLFNSKHFNKPCNYSKLF